LTHKSQSPIVQLGKESSHILTTGLPFHAVQPVRVEPLMLERKTADKIRQGRNIGNVESECPVIRMDKGSH